MLQVICIFRYWFLTRWRLVLSILGLGSLGNVSYSKIKSSSTGKSSTEIHSFSRHSQALAEMSISIYCCFSNENVTKIAKLSHWEFPHLVQNHENICMRNIWHIQNVIQVLLLHTVSFPQINTSLPRTQMANSSSNVKSHSVGVGRRLVPEYFTSSSSMSKCTLQYPMRG